jgi:hypothetical protein
MKDPLLWPLQRTLVVHGGLVLMLGFVAGFGFLFHLLGAIELWPIPGRIDYQLPGSYKAWRMSHLEGVMNGLMLWLVAAALPVFRLPGKSAKRVTVALLITAWTFPVASLFDAFFDDSRGLRFAGPVTNLVPFFLFYVGIIALVWAVIEVMTKVGKGQA